MRSKNPLINVNKNKHLMSKPLKTNMKEKILKAVTIQK